MGFSTDRSTLETITKATDEFVESFCEQLKLLLTHSFVAQQQSSFQLEAKSNLQSGVFQVIADFSENNSFVFQDEAQGFHWNNSQATVHHFMVYYMESGMLHQLSYVVISECLHHNTVAVFVFQKSLIEFLSKKFSPQKILYLSDGAAAQYKNRKNFLNLCHHKVDFGIDAEWHFFATSHGKGPCDGLGGTVKRLAARASLQRPYDHQKITPRQLYEWASENIPAVSFSYCTTEDYKVAEAFLHDRTIPGTQMLHCFIPISKSTISTKVYSNSDTQKVERVTLSETTELSLEEINGFVTAVKNDQWWVGCVLRVEEECRKLFVIFLNTHGPSHTFAYPLKKQILSVPQKIFYQKLILELLQVVHTPSQSKKVSNSSTD